MKAIIFSASLVLLSGCQWTPLSQFRGHYTPLVEAEVPECLYLAILKLPEMQRTGHASFSPSQARYPRWDVDQYGLMTLSEHAPRRPQNDLPGLMEDIAWECNNLLYTGLDYRSNAG
ncbi:MAG: hypothetical protein OIF57_02345 [Marinobacterium sp.]|nr:hypothetical protein [Marinobacterium sp.]